MKRKGILSGQYAQNRNSRNELIFRLCTRSMIVKKFAGKLLEKTSKLNILDLGSADGKTIKEMDNLFSECVIFGVEISEELVKSYNILSQNINITIGDITRPLFFKEEIFDVVSALAVLEHVNNPMITIAESYKLLKSGGVFIATCPVPIWDSISTSIGLLEGDQHETSLDKKYLVKMLKRVGFKKIIYNKFMFAPISFLPYLNIKVSPEIALSIDQVLYSLKILDWLFVNQLVVGVK